MKTLLITIAQNNPKKAAAFQNLLEQLHSALVEHPIAFEMVSFGQNIGFCVTAPSHLCEVISGQIYAMNPEMDIVEIPDFFLFVEPSPKHPSPQPSPTGRGGVASAELFLKKSELFPIKNFSRFESDSLSGLLNVLSKVNPSEGAVVQLVIQSQKDSGWFHFRLGWKKFWLKWKQKFWVKYWFKKGMTSVFDDAVKEKTQEKLFRCSFRVLTFGNTHTTKDRLNAVLGAIRNYSITDLNGFFPKLLGNIVPKSFKKRTLHKSFLLSASEVATLFHLPNEFEVSSLITVSAKKGEPPADLPVEIVDKNISFFGETNFHGQRIPFGIHRNDRRRHLYAVGKSGSGKSKLLELLIQNDILQGKGVGVLDPHGDLVDNVLKMIPENRIKDVILFDPADTEFPLSFNPLADVPPELKIRVSVGFIEIFKKLFGAGWTPRLEHVLRYTTLALLDTPNTTILSILQMLTDKNYRQDIVRNIQDSVVKNFWTNEFAGWSEKFDAEAITPLLNKVGQFVATNMIRNMIGQPKNKIDFREIMDGKKILLMKVSKGILGEENASLLGAIAITKIYQAAMSRADTEEEKREDFYFYVDEFQNFATDTFDEILSEARKYRLNLTIAHQFLGQLSAKIRTTVFGNVGSMISFRVGGEDAKILAEEYNPRFSERDIINLGVREFYCKISINGELREAFSGRTLNISLPEKNFAEECKNFSRKTYALPKKEVERILDGNHASISNDDGIFVEPII